MQSFDEWFKSASEEERVLELINRRRRQVLVHSCLYYQMDTNIVSDHQWTAWAFELAELQNTYPEIAAKGVFAKDFENFDGSSGYDLPFTNPWAMHKAEQLLSYHRKPKKEVRQ